MGMPGKGSGARDHGSEVRGRGSEVRGRGRTMMPHMRWEACVIKMECHLLTCLFFSNVLGR